MVLHDRLRTLLIPATVHGRVLVSDVPEAPGVLVGCHGYMESAAIQMERLQAIAPDRWTLVSVQGLHRFYRGRSEDVVASWMTRQDRESAIEDNIEYVNRVVAAVRRDGQALVFAGFSQGVAAAFRSAVRGTAATAGIIAVGGDVPPELLDDQGLAFPRVLLARGSEDDWYTAAKLQADVAALRARGAQVEPLTYRGGHEWTAEVSDIAGRFIRSIQ